ncbi:MAG: amidohydrolase family protein [Coriobacteriales bacterium]|nr:amidohydrolase family protein [Coriobacteriales bacterium]
MLFKNITLLDENFDAQTNMYVGTINDKIIYVGASEPNNSTQFGEIYSGAGKLLTPAFYNTHTHSYSSLMRGYAQGLPLQEWLETKIWPFEAKMTDETNYWGTMLACAEMIRLGTVSFSDMYVSTRQRIYATLQCGMKANHCDGGTMIFNDTPYDQLEVAKLNEDLFNEFNNAPNDKIKIDMCLHSEYTTKEAMIKSIIDVAKQHNAIVHLHNSETRNEVEECKERHNGMTPTQYLDSLGFFKLGTNCAHCNYLSDEDIEILLKAKSNICLNPISNAKLGSGINDYIRLQKSGLNLSIGTDGPSSSDTHDMLKSAFLLICMLRAQTCNPTLGNAKDLLKMLTVKGAQARGRPICGLEKEG